MRGDILYSIEFFDNWRLLFWLIYNLVYLSTRYRLSKSKSDKKPKDLIPRRSQQFLLQSSMLCAYPMPRTEDHGREVWSILIWVAVRHMHQGSPTTFTIGVPIGVYCYMQLWHMIHKRTALSIGGQEVAIVLIVTWILVVLKEYHFIISVSLPLSSRRHGNSSLLIAADLIVLLQSSNVRESYSTALIRLCAELRLPSYYSIQQRHTDVISLIHQSERRPDSCDFCA